MADHSSRGSGRVRLTGACSTVVRGNSGADMVVPPGIKVAAISLLPPMRRLPAPGTAYNEGSSP